MQETILSLSPCSEGHELIARPSELDHRVLSLVPVGCEHINYRFPFTLPLQVIDFLLAPFREGVLRRPEVQHP